MEEQKALNDYKLYDWGKRNEELILPINDSISMTLSTNELSSKTTIAASASFRTNRMWLNGEAVPFEGNPRIMRCLKAVQDLVIAKKKTYKFPLDWKLHIVSKNNFPTAAGLASSAAGYACLVYTLAILYDVADDELTAIARMGSGSACRSLYGGFVHWQMGQLENGIDSIATPIASENHWPQMHVLILVTSDECKKTSSTIGMQRSVETSELIQYRAKFCVPERIRAIIEAIHQKDFASFAEIVMKDSNQFHAIAMDTYPPCLYMNDVSHAIISFVHEYNAAANNIQIAYTFDAGSNACLYMLEDNVGSVFHALQVAFPNDKFDSTEYLRGKPIEVLYTDSNKESLLSIHKRNLLKYIIHSKIGAGPQRLDETDSLVHLITGFPL